MASAGKSAQLDWEMLRNELLHLEGQWLVTATDPRGEAFLVFHAAHDHVRQTGEGLEIELRCEPVVAGGRFMLLKHDFNGASESDDAGRRVFRIELGCFTVQLEQHIRT